jgi:hypothetical protein
MRTQVELKTRRQKKRRKEPSLISNLQLRWKNPKSDQRRQRRREGIGGFSRATTAGPGTSEGPKVVARNEVFAGLVVSKGAEETWVFRYEWIDVGQCVDVRG